MACMEVGETYGYTIAFMASFSIRVDFACSLVSCFRPPAGREGGGKYAQCQT
jgi:hypothetical protein